MQELLLMMGGRKKKVVNFPEGNSTFTTSGITEIQNVVGRGQDGTPYSYFYGYIIYETVTTQQSNGSESTVGPYFVDTVYYQYPPADGCVQTGGTYPRTNTCRTHEFFENEVQATTGEATTGFTKTFPGGVEQAATAVSYPTVAVNPNQAYPVHVAPGGALSITYWE